MKLEVEFNSGAKYFQLANTSKVISKVNAVLEGEGVDIEYYFNFVFLSDEELLQINQDYLQHDYYTDIITFPIEETEEYLEADIYISVDRVRDNANEFKVEYADEMMRVILHGVLHLCGFKDKTEEEIKVMRSKEQEYLLK